MTPDTHPNRRHIPRRFILPHDIAPSNTSQPITRRDRRRDPRPFPLPNDIVRLIGVQGRPVRDIRPRGEIGPDIPHRDLRRETEHAEPRDEARGVEDDDGPADAVPVADERGQEHGDHGVVVRWAGEEDGLVGVEAHPALEDDGEEVREGGTDEVQEEEERAEAVEFRVEEVDQYVLPCEGGRFGVGTVTLDPCEHGFGFFGCEEVEGVLGVFGEVDHPPVGYYADHAGEETLHEEHPAPALKTGTAVEVVEAKVEDAACGEDNDLS